MLRVINRDKSTWTAFNCRLARLYYYGLPLDTVSFKIAQIDQNRIRCISAHSKRNKCLKMIGSAETNNDQYLIFCFSKTADVTNTYSL